MESIDSIKQRLRNCEETVQFLKKMNAPQDLIERNKQSLQLTKNELQRRLDKAK